MKLRGRSWLQLATAASLAASSAAIVASLVLGEVSVVAAIAMGLLVAAVLLAVLGDRRLRRRVAITEQRLRAQDSDPVGVSSSRTMQRRPRAPHDVRDQVELLEARLDVSDALLAVARPSQHHELGQEAAINAVTRLVALDRVLDADQVVRRFALTTRLPLGLVRTLARGVRSRGYLARAQVYFERAAEVGDVRDRRMLELRAAEVAMMSGAFRPSVLPSTVGAVAAGRVLHVVGRAVPSTQSGYTLRTHATARAQVDRGLDVHVFVQSGVLKEERAASECIDGVWYHRQSGGSVFDVGHVRWLQENADALQRRVLELSPMVLHAHSDFINGILATAVGRATGVPVVYESRGFWEETWLSRTAKANGWADSEAIFETFGVPESYGWRRQREAEARTSADATVTLGRAMRDHIVAEGLSAELVTIVPNAVDATEFDRDGRADLLAHSLGISSEATVVGCVTSVVEYEGLGTLVDAFAQVEQQSAGPVWLLIVGDGPVLEELRDRVKRRGLRCVSTPGRVPHSEVTDYLSLIDIFVVPRRDVEVCRLVTPLKPFEAFAAGCALVVSDVPALREIAEESGAAEMFEADHAPSLAAVLIRLVNEPRARREMAERGARWVRASRGWHRNAARYEDLYRTVSPRAVERAEIAS